MSIEIRQCFTEEVETIDYCSYLLNNLRENRKLFAVDSFQRSAQYFKRKEFHF